jgi:dTMP kinase
MPDLTVLVDLPVSESSRRASGRDRGPAADGRRFEQAPASFHMRVLGGFRALAAAEPGRWLVVDGGKPMDRISGEIWSRVASLLGLQQRPAGA